jgi:hypothetical protein
MTSLGDELAKLAELHAKGSLDDEEFKAAKAAAIAKPSSGFDEICFRLWNGASVSIQRSRATTLPILTNDVVEFLQLHSTPFKLYYIPGHNPTQFNSRVKLNGPSSFATYTQLLRPRPPVLVFVSKSEDESPKGPYQDSQSDGASVSSSTKSEKRNDANQELFSKAVRDRDQCCVACGSIETETLQGAHVYPFEWRKELSKHSAHLEIGHVFETSNGVCLCVSCHSLFDRGYWCVKLGKFYVSEALEGSGAKVVKTNGKPFPCFLRDREGAAAAIPDEEARLFPGPHTWAAREAYFNRKRSDRHEVQGKAKVHCSKCCEPFQVDGKGLKNHEMSCSGMTMRYFLSKPSPLRRPRIQTSHPKLRAKSKLKRRKGKPCHCAHFIN